MQQLPSPRRSWPRPGRVGAWYTPVTDSLAAVATTANRLYLSPLWLPGPRRYDRIGVRVLVAVAATTVRLGVYSDTGAHRANARLLDAGTIDSSSAGTKEIIINQQLPEFCWLACVSNGAPQIHFGSNVGVIPSEDMIQHTGYFLADIGSTALPAQIDGVVTLTSAATGPRLGLRLA